MLTIFETGLNLIVFFHFSVDFIDSDQILQILYQMMVVNQTIFFRLF